MRILFVLRFDAGGTVTGLLDQVRGLDRDRYEPVVLFYRANRHVRDFAALGARVHVLPELSAPAASAAPVRGVYRGLRRSRAGRQLVRLVRQEWPRARRIARLMDEERIDLVYHNDNSRAHRGSILGARLADVPQVCHVRSFTKYYRPVDGPLASCVDLFLYMSSALEAEVRGRLGVPAHRGRVIADPFDVSSYAPNPAASERVRAELGVDPGASLVSVVGRLVPWKGQDVFLHAMAGVVRSHPGALALVVGAAGDAAGMRYERELRALAGRLGLSARVRFTGFRRDVPALLAASDVVVHSSSEPEPFGRVIVEAMCAARPVVATGAGGVTDIVQDGATGLLVPPGDPERMAAAICRLLDDPDGARRMGARACRSASARYAMSTQVAAFQAVFDRLAGSRRRVA